MSGASDRRDNQISHIYKAGNWPEPRRQIDQAILAAARRRQPFFRRWAPTLAFAATIVLSSAILLKTFEENPEETLVTVPASDQAVPSTSKPKSAAVTKSAAELAPPAARAAKPAPIENKAPAARTAPVVRPSPDRLGGVAVLKKDVPAPGPRRERAAEAAVVPPRAREAAQARATVPDTPTQAQPPSAPPRASAAPAPPLVAPAPSVSAASGRDSTPNIAATPAAPERSPQSWLEDIRKLKSEGGSAEAARQLAEFRKRYPDYPLPEDLR
jgi:hypothetical protein